MSGVEPTSTRPRLLFIQASLHPPGGPPGVGAWILQALRRDYAVDVMTWAPLELEVLNRYYGTELDRDSMRILAVPPFLRLLDLAPTPGELLKTAILLRRSRSIADRYDALLNANNEIDFGRLGIGIQYIHYPWSFRSWPAADPSAGRPPAALRGYLALVNRLWRFRPESVRRNLTLVNSDWTGARVREVYPGATPRTLHPPAAGSFPEVPWSEREDGVVVLGRISPVKRIDLAIDVVRRVRERGRALRLHVIGTVDDRAAYRGLAALAAEHASWLTVHEDLSRAELGSLVARQRYGLHATAKEHYGMAVAEMVVAGLIPFVPDDGGQREIVAAAPEVLWRTPDEAVERMLAVMAEPERQHRIRSVLLARRETLGTAHFMRRVRDEVAAFIAAGGSSRPVNQRP